MPTLYVLSGPDVGASAELVEGSILGRATEAQLRLRDRSISRKHARLELRQGAWVIADLNSRNGLFDAEGNRVRHIELEDGVELRVGEVELRARVEASEMSAPQPAAQPVPKAPPADEEIELDEIDLEDPDEIDLGEASSRAPEPQAKTPEKAPPGAPRGMRGAREATPPPSLAKKKKAKAPAGGFGGNDLERTTLTARAAARAGVNVATSPAQKDILQYSKQPQRGGLFAADLEQQPLWKRSLFVLLALLIAGGLAFGIWRTVLFLKARNAPLGSSFGDPSESSLEEETQGE